MSAAPHELATSAGEDDDIEPSWLAPKMAGSIRKTALLPNRGHLRQSVNHCRRESKVGQGDARTDHGNRGFRGRHGRGARSVCDCGATTVCGRGVRVQDCIRAREQEVPIGARARARQPAPPAAARPHAVFVSTWTTFSKKARRRSGGYCRRRRSYSGAASSTYRRALPLKRGRCSASAFALSR